MSEPVFEAFVRLRVNTVDVERQAAASLKESLDRAEAQIARLAQSQTRATPATSLAGALAPSTVVTDFERALAQARRLTAEPLNIEVLAQTAPFERDTAAAFERAGQLAREQVGIAGQAARAARQEFGAALKELTAPGTSVQERAAGVVASRAKQEIRNATRAALREAESLVRTIEAEAQAAQIRPLSELETRSRTALIRSDTAAQGGDQAASDAFALEAAVLGKLAQAEAERLQASEFLAQASATLNEAEKDELNALAERAAQAARTLQAEAGQLQTSGLPPPIDPRGAGGPGGRLQDLLGGRSAGLAGVIGMTTRFGALGLATGAVIGGLSEAQQALRVTGDEAFTAEGKIRNLGAELLTGNIVGGIKALFAEPQLKLLGDLPAQIQAMKDKIDPLAVTEEKLIDIRSRGADALGRYLEVQLAFGHISLQQAIDLNKVTEEIYKQTAAFEASGNVLRDLAQRREAAPGEELLPPRAPGAQFQRTGVPEGATFGTREETLAAGAGNLAAANQIRASRAARIENDRERLALELKSAVIIEAQAVAGARAVAGTRAEGAALATQVAARTEVILTRRALVDAEERAAEVSREQGNAIRESIASRIQDEQGRLAAETEIARMAQAQARKIFEGKRDTDEAAAAWLAFVQSTTTLVGAVVAEKAAIKAGNEALADAIQEAKLAGAQQSNDVGTQRDILMTRAADAAREVLRLTFQGDAAALAAAIREQTTANEALAAFNKGQKETAKTAGETARTAAETAAASAKNATEQALANDIAAAGLTKRKSDDIKFTNIAIDYYRALGKSAGTAEEREAAQAKVLSLRASLTQGGGNVEGLVLQKLQNAMQQAETVGSVPLMRRASDKIIAYWEKQRDSLTGMEKAVAQSNLTTERTRARQFDAEVDSREDLVFQNRAAAARLRGDSEAEKQIADDLIAVWRKRVKDAQGFEKERAKSGLLAAQAARKALEGDSSDGAGGPSTIDFLGISRKLFQDFAGNLLPTGGDAAARGLFSGMGLPDFGATDAELGDEELRELRRIRELLEKGAATTEVKVDQHFQQPDYSGFQQARWIKFAMEQVANG